MTPLVLVHGFMGGSAQWDLQREYLEQLCPVVTVDLPGFGENNHLPPIATIEGFADWIIAHLVEKGITTFHLMGHSMGGMIVQQMAHQVPDRIEKLILYGTGAVGMLPGRFETIAQSKQRAKEDGVASTARRIAATWFVETEAAAEYPACARIAEQSAAMAFDAGLDAMQGWSGTDYLAGNPLETLVLWGDQDRTYLWRQIERLWRSIPSTSLAVIPGCAHAVHMEKPDLFNRIVADFLTS
ncbi:alpha/beta hydrolase [Roseobacter sp. YSTF-M11]|uniref:Alpha/beta hydrolase n=1 Tax=Roseobacter insulae TaxID=2859783 RepID=A0A9X1K4B0_9RHOB|nr:alpha/beta hydrolase [Roseobacter insulae]MBW4710428.1 alpha/beta hydrolase [Roseobacter insulae]